ncbi:MAG TPA: hypothetical protein VFM34_01435 [Moraxellaceae bacterium]|nr:hypothetical protein [Moraxellaceae bacterium]
MNLHTNLAIRTAARFDYEGAYDRAATEIAEAIAAGQPIKCANYTLDHEDFGEFVATRPEFDCMVSDLAASKISAIDFSRWIARQVDSFADHYAPERAQHMLEDCIDAAEQECR